eukprot:CAMPEP_0177644212 /NCGR_PEP_ID=MMETSP0447-20121125/8562_1 /TAXON_ID=0 /ORGANISM="Stygamoeba regulata, Strain BSH-02190019" /LENGTH=1023 /DNA_ID=CAMNT_0019146547 /DNA_START=119 /DNA_END=3190 /DNA_ORIENTATION=+
MAEHVFFVHHFRSPHWCQWCGKFIWGLGKQGYRCRNCHYAAHRGDCHKHAMRNSNCHGVIISKKDRKTLKPDSTRMNLRLPAVEASDDVATDTVDDDLALLNRCHMPMPATDDVGSVLMGGGLDTKMGPLGRTQTTSPRKMAEAAAGLTSNTTLHSFQPHHFNKPTWCRFCNKFIWGIGKQGYFCKVCQYPAHSKCYTQVTEHCNAVNLTIEEEEDDKQVAAQFKAAMAAGKSTGQDLIRKVSTLDEVKDFIHWNTWALTYVDEQGQTMVHVLCEEGRVDVLRHLIEKRKSFDVNLQDKRGWSPLHCAAAKNNLNLLELLLIRCGAYAGLVSNDHATIIHLLVQNNQAPSGALLVETVMEAAVENGADVNISDDKGETALHQAAAIGSASLCELLIKLKADVDAANRDGETPLHIAARKGHEAVVKLLVAHGADVKATGDNGTPLFVAVDPRIKGLLASMQEDWERRKALTRDDKAMRSFRRTNPARSSGSFLRVQVDLSKVVTGLNLQGSIPLEVNAEGTLKDLLLKIPRKYLHPDQHNNVSICLPDGRFIPSGLPHLVEVVVAEETRVDASKGLAIGMDQTFVQFFNAFLGVSNPEQRSRLTVDMSSDDKLRFSQDFCIQLKRGLRYPSKAPADNKPIPTPAPVGDLKSLKVADYAENIPEDVSRLGGLLLPMYQSESLWLCLSAACPHAVRVGVDGLNCLTGKKWTKALDSTEQDFFVCPPQHWITAFKGLEPGTIQQLVPPPLDVLACKQVMIQVIPQMYDDVIFLRAPPSNLENIRSFQSEVNILTTPKQVGHKLGDKLFMFSDRLPLKYTPLSELNLQASSSLQILLADARFENFQIFIRNPDLTINYPFSVHINSTVQMLKRAIAKKLGVTDFALTLKFGNTLLEETDKTLAWYGIRRPDSIIDLISADELHEVYDHLEELGKTIDFNEPQRRMQPLRRVQWDMSRSVRLLINLINSNVAEGIEAPIPRGPLYPLTYEVAGIEWDMDWCENKEQAEEARQREEDRREYLKMKGRAL